MKKIKIGLLNKKRGNFKLQEKFAGADKVVDETYKEVEHHKQALLDAGYEVCIINWGPSFITDIENAEIITEPLTEFQIKRRITWAALIKCVYEVDPLECPKCGEQMKIISFMPFTLCFPFFCLSILKIF